MTYAAMQVAVPVPLGGIVIVVVHVWIGRPSSVIWMVTFACTGSVTLRYWFWLTTLLDSVTLAWQPLVPHGASAIEPSGESGTSESTASANAPIRVCSSV